MTPITQLGFLLLFLVTANSSRQKTESKTLTLHDYVPDKDKDDDKGGKLLRCFICKKLMRRVIPSISQKIHKKLNSACNTLKPLSWRTSCIKHAIKLRDFLVDCIFPGRSPEKMCKMIDMCW
ncbi:hypothetical protein AOLI_G00128250 [Acnodon oligacanthus]